MIKESNKRVSITLPNDLVELLDEAVDHLNATTKGRWTRSVFIHRLILIQLAEAEEHKGGNNTNA